MSVVVQAAGWPPAREFIVSPGFAGAAAVVAAVIALCAVLYSARRAGKRSAQQLEQRERHHQQARDDEQHAAAVQRCWGRLTWLVQTAGIEPASSEGATLGLGPELALELLRGLLRDAEALGDDTLASAVTVYQSQFSLVLAQQGGPLSALAGADVQAASEPTADGKPDQRTSPDGAPDKPAPAARGAPDKPASAAVDETSSAAAAVASGEPAGGGRRRRR